MPRTLRLAACLGGAFLVAIVGASQFGVAARRWSGPGPTAVARMQLGNLGAAVQLYGLDRRAFPARLDDLARRERAPGEPYIARVPRDPWGRPYAYRVMSVSTGAIELRSLGEDGRPGTDDDIVLGTLVRW